MGSPERIARLRVQLDDWKPAIWRRVEVPLTISLKALHDVIQAVMPFDDCHLFEFCAEGKRHAIPDPEWDSFGDTTYSAKTVKLSALVEQGVRALTYTYDFGGDWKHTVTVETIGPADPAVEYPRYVDGEGRAPPEDVGGVFGFESFLEAMADPSHEEHADTLRWYGGPFDPKHVDEDEIRKRVGKLARRRTLGKAAFAKSRHRVH